MQQRLAALRANGGNTKEEDQPWYKDVLGATLGNSVVKAVLKPLDWLQTGGRAVTTGLEHAARALPEQLEPLLGTLGMGVDEEKSREDDRSVIERIQGKDVYGYGQIAKSTGNKWLDRGVGLVGDIVMDPLTYATLGASAAAGKTGRLSNATKAIMDGLGDDVAARAVKGASWLNDAERGALGLQKAGVRMAGVNVPGTAKLANAVGKGTGTVRRALTGSRPWQTISRAPEHLKLATRVLETGVSQGAMTPTAAAATLAWDKTYRVISKTISNEAAVEANKILGPLDERARKALTEAMESGKLDMAGSPELRKVFDDLLGQAREAGVKVGEIENYMPHFWTDEARAFMTGKTITQNGKTITLDLTKESGVTLERQLRGGIAKFNGKEVDLGNGSIKAINEAMAKAFPTAGVASWLKDDVKDLASMYIGKISHDIGEVHAFKRLMDSKAGVAGDLRDVSDEVINSVATKTANRELATHLKETKRLRAVEFKAEQVVARKQAVKVQDEIVRWATEAMGDVGPIGQRLTDQMEFLAAKGKSLVDQHKALTETVNAERIKAVGLIDSQSKQLAKVEDQLLAAKVGVANASTGGPGNVVAASNIARQKAQLEAQIAAAKQAKTEAENAAQMLQHLDEYSRKAVDALEDPDAMRALASELAGKRLSDRTELQLAMDDLPSDQFAKLTGKPLATARNHAGISARSITDDMLARIPEQYATAFRELRTEVDRMRLAVGNPQKATLTAQRSAIKREMDDLIRSAGEASKGDMDMLSTLLSDTLGKVSKLDDELWALDNQISDLAPSAMGRAPAKELADADHRLNLMTDFVGRQSKIATEKGVKLPPAQQAQVIAREVVSTRANAVRIERDRLSKALLKDADSGRRLELANQIDHHAERVFTLERELDASRSMLDKYTGAGTLRNAESRVARIQKKLDAATTADDFLKFSDELEAAKGELAGAARNVSSKKISGDSQLGKMAGGTDAELIPMGEEAYWFQRIYELNEQIDFEKEMFDAFVGATTGKWKMPKTTMSRRASAELDSTADDLVVAAGAHDKAFKELLDATNERKALDKKLKAGRTKGGNVATGEVRARKIDPEIKRVEQRYQAAKADYDRFDPRFDADAARRQASKVGGQFVDAEGKITTAGQDILEVMRFRGSVVGGPDTITPRFNQLVDELYAQLDQVSIDKLDTAAGARLADLNIEFAKLEADRVGLGGARFGMKDADRTVTKDWRDVIFDSGESGTIQAKALRYQTELDAYKTAETNAKYIADEAAAAKTMQTRRVAQGATAEEQLPQLEGQLGGMPTRMRDEQLRPLEDAQGNLATAGAAVNKAQTTLDRTTAAWTGVGREIRAEMDDLDQAQQAVKGYESLVKMSVDDMKAQHVALKKRADSVGAVKADKDDVAKTFEQLDALVKELPNDPRLAPAIALHEAYAKQMAKLGKMDADEAIWGKALDMAKAGSKKGSKEHERLHTIFMAQAHDGWERVAENLLSPKHAIAVQKPIADALSNMRVASANGELWKTIDGLTKFFKTYATMSPGFHVRNAMSAAFMNATEGVGLGLTREAYRNWAEYERAPMAFMKRIEKEDPQLFDAFRAAFGSGAGGAFDPAELGDTRKFMNNWFTNKSKKAGLWVEGPARLALALKTTRGGGDVYQALSQVTRIHFDYSQLSKLDQNIKLMIPFWTFMSRNLPLQLQQMYMKPGLYSAWNHVADNLSAGNEFEGMPWWLKDKSPASLGLLGGDQMVLTPDLPHLGLMEDIAAYDPRDPLRFLSNLNPMAVGPLQALDGKRWRTGSEMDGGDSLEFLAQSMLPTFGTAQRLTGSGRYEGQAMEKMLQWLGVPLQQVSPKEIQTELAYGK